MGKTYKKAVQNKFDKKKLNNIKKKLLSIGEIEDEDELEFEVEALQSVCEEDGAGENL